MDGKRLNRVSALLSTAKTGNEQTPCVSEVVYPMKPLFCQSFMSPPWK
jgi:hypothetical protein